MSRWQTNYSLYKKYHLGGEELKDLKLKRQTKKEIIHEMADEFDGHVIVYGIEGLVNLFKTIESEKTLSVLVIEDDKKKLSQFFSHTQAESLLQHEKVKIIFSSTAKKLKLQLNELLIQRVFPQLHWVNTKASPLSEELKQFALALALEHEQLFAYYTDGGIKAFSNFCSNAKALSSINILDDMNYFANQPAIIVGAGASITSLFDAFNQMKKKAWVIAAGTAGSILLKNKLSPHFVAHCDPHSPYERMKGQKKLKTPVFYDWLSNAEVVGLFNEKILVASKPRFAFESQFCKNIDFFPKQQISAWTVGAFAAKIAHSLGCSPIILVGMDYCYQNDQKYPVAMGQETETTIEIEKAAKQYKTQKDWILSINELEDLAKNSSTKFYNLSRGIPIEGFTSIETISALDTVLEKDIDVSILKKIKQTKNEIQSPLIIKGQLLAWDKEIQQMLEECTGYMQQLEKYFSGKEMAIDSMTFTQNSFTTILDYQWSMMSALILRETKNLMPEMPKTLVHNIHKLLFYKKGIAEYCDVLGQALDEYE